MLPATQRRVRLEGREGLFLVMGVDFERRTADLVPIGPIGPGDPLEDVPFSEIRVLHDGELDEAPASPGSSVHPEPQASSPTASD